jgi:hypothetical protein
MEIFFSGDSVSNLLLTTDTIKLRMAYYDDDTYATIAQEFDIWTNQLNILERINQINDTILRLLEKQLK